LASIEALSTANNGRRALRLDFAERAKWFRDQFI
jgi:hypothetical protein